MKKTNYFFLTLTFFLMFVCLSNTFAQTPQYYNYNTTSGSNYFPFGVVAGKQVQWLVLSGELQFPTPITNGNLTKLYIMMSYTNGNVTLTDLTIKLGLCTLTTLPSGVIYTGPLDTVYFRSSVTLTSTIGQWMVLVFDRPFLYDNTKSLVIDISQCGATNTSMLVSQTTLSGFRRTAANMSGMCNFVESYQGGEVLNCGFDVAPAVTVCDYYSSLWCTTGTLPNLPAASYFNASTWLGDTLYVQTPDASGAGTTTIIRYKYGGAWSTGVPLPGTKTGGTLTQCGTKMYYIGGGTTSILTPSNECLEYSPTTGWTQKATIPTALAAHGSVNWGDSVIFVIGGPYSSPTTTVYYFRPASNTWGTSTAMPSGTARRTFACGISGNKIFVAAGYSGSTYLKSFYIGTIGANASTITWAAGPDVPTTETGLSRPGGIGYQNYFYVIGGEKASSGYSDQSFIWNVPGAVWLPMLPGKPTGVSNIFSTVAAKCINDTTKIFVPGGYNGAGISNFEMIGCGPTIVGTNNNHQSIIPGSFSLEQNYPNPFNPTTTITYNLPKTSNVELKVYDLLGREVAVLVNESKHAGTYEVQFNGDKIASGVYFYKLTAGDFTSTKKMLLIK